MIKRLEKKLEEIYLTPSLRYMVQENVSQMTKEINSVVENEELTREFVRYVDLELQPFALTAIFDVGTKSYKEKLYCGECYPDFEECLKVKREQIRNSKERQEVFEKISYYAKTKLGKDDFIEQYIDAYEMWREPIIKNLFEFFRLGYYL